MISALNSIRALLVWFAERTSPYPDKPGSGGGRKPETRSGSDQGSTLASSVVAVPGCEQGSTLASSVAAVP
jgi:hypothetical protein